MYLFFDLETTGLNPVEDRILEVGWTLADDTFDANPIQSRIVRFMGKANHREQWDPAVLAMHTDSGLLGPAHPRLRLGAVENEIVEQITKLGSIAVLAGFGPHFDRAFIQRYMPDLAALLHYRMFDVRTLTTFFDALDIDHGVPAPNKHRAGPDVLEALSVARSYARQIATSGDFYTSKSLDAFGGTN